MINAYITTAFVTVMMNDNSNFKQLRHCNHRLSFHVHYKGK